MNSRLKRRRFRSSQLLVAQGIARELTSKPRNRLFVYDRYLSILNEETEAS